MNLRNLTLLTSLLIALCGCDANNAMLNTAIEQAEKADDPVKSYHILRDAETKIDHSLLYSASDFYVAFLKYKLKAAAKLDPLALDDLYDTRNIAYVDEVEAVYLDKIRDDQEALRVKLWLQVNQVQ